MNNIMKQIRTSNLQGAALDYAVAMCEGTKWSHSYQPSTSWSEGGPIVERERIAILPPMVKRITDKRHALTLTEWRAMIQADEDMPAVHARGKTALIAALRCYIEIKLGEVVEIPGELV